MFLCLYKEEEMHFFKMMQKEAEEQRERERVVSTVIV